MTDAPVLNATISSARVTRDASNETEHEPPPALFRPFQIDVNNRLVQSKAISQDPLANSSQQGSRPFLAPRSLDRQGVKQQTAPVENYMLACPQVKELIVLPQAHPPLPPDIRPVSIFPDAQEPATVAIINPHKDALPLEKVVNGKETLHRVCSYQLLHWKKRQC